MRISTSLLAGALLLGAASQATAATVEWQDPDSKIKWELNTSTGTATVLNLISAAIKTPDMVLPESVTYQGRSYKVTAIGKKVCINNAVIETLTLSQYIESIDSAAFSGSEKLTKVTLNEGLKTIAIRAFAGCSKLTDIYVPNSVTTFGPYSFQGTKFTTFNFGPNVTSIGANPFRSSTTLKAITVDAANTKYCAKEGVLFSKDMRDLICLPSGIGPSSYTVPEGVVNIGDNSMRNNSALKAVTFPTTLETIGEMAFGVDGLTTVNISKNVRYIGPAAFYMNSSLTGFTVDPANPNYKAEEGLLLSKDGKTLISTIMRSGEYTIPATVEEVGRYSFYGCSGLTALKMTGVKTIGNAAFYNCTGLTTVDFGNALVEIDTMAFQYDRQITSLKFPASTRRLKMQAFCYCSGITDLQLNQGLEYIGNMTFYSNNGLTKVTVPASVTMEGACFYYCSGLTTLVLEEGFKATSSLSFSNCGVLRSVTLPESLTTLGSSTFQLCTNLRSIQLPAGLKVMESHVFNRSGLRGDIVLPDGVEALEQYDYASVKNITSFTAGRSLKRIGEGVFNGCSKLADIRLNEGLQTIGVNALSIIDSVRTLVIPSTVTRMDSLCINYNTNMEDLVLKPATPPAVNGLLAHYIGMKKNGQDWNPYEYTTLHVPAASVEAYRNHPEWGRFVRIIGDADGVEGVQNDADATIVDVYDLRGVRLAAPQPGQINIIRWSDGRVTKQLVTR